MMTGLETIFGAVIQLGAGILFLLIGLMLSENLNALLMLFTHRELPEYVRDKEEVNNVLNYIKAIGIIVLVIGVVLIVFGLIRVGIHLFG